MEINPSWNYKECLYFISSIKEKYEGIMSSFCIFGGNLKTHIKIREIKKCIYSIQIEEWKRDKLWEYLNNDISYVDLWRFI